MTIEEVLAAEGYTDEEQTALLGNPKNKGMLTKILQQSEEGTTALLKAQQLEADIRRFNDETVIPYGAKKDQEVSEVRGKLANALEVLKSIKEQGYPVTDAQLEVLGEKASAKNEPVKVEPKYVQPDDLDKQGRAYMSLLSTVNRAHKLGIDVDVDADYAEMKKNGRPNENFRDYLDRKYDMTAKETAAATQKKSDYEEKLRKEGEERYQKANPRSANDDLQIARASKFDRFQKLPDEARDAHKTLAGREKATQTRLEKYRDLLVQ